MNKLFWVDGNQQIGYDQLIEDLNCFKDAYHHIWVKNTYEILLRIVHSLVYDYPIIMYDSDFTFQELKTYGYRENKPLDFEATRIKLKSPEDIYLKIKHVNSWKITLLTSGTTGTPKKITH